MIDCPLIFAFLSVALADGHVWVPTPRVDHFWIQCSVPLHESSQHPPVVLSVLGIEQKETRGKTTIKVAI